MHYFNHIFDTCSYPNAWTKEVIVPLCGVRGRGVERRPRNLEIPSLIPGSGCQLREFFIGPHIRREYWCSSQEAESTEISISCKNLFLNRCKKNMFKTNCSFILKKSESRQSENYRGITLMNITAKIWSLILRNAFIRCAKDSNLSKNQFGTRDGHFIADAILILHSPIQKVLSKNCKLWCIFIDY